VNALWVIDHQREEREAEEKQCKSEEVQEVEPEAKSIPFQVKVRPHHWMLQELNRLFLHLIQPHNVCISQEHHSTH
jgi:hypothetical protein